MSQNQKNHGKQLSNPQGALKIEMDVSLEKSLRNSFSPMKNLKILQSTIKQSQQPLQNLPILISSLPEPQQPQKSTAIQSNPIIYLLHHQSSRGLSTANKRSEQEIDLILKLIEGNKIWKDLGFDEAQQSSLKINDFGQQQMLKQICNSIVLVWSQIPNITQTKSNQIYLILEGKTFEYIHNENTSLKFKIHQNNDYLMIRKLVQNDYFVTLPPIKSKPKSNQNLSEKYQLMVDEKTLLGKISDQLFHKWIHKRMLERVRELTFFMRKILLFENLPDIVFQQLSKFISLKKIDQNVQIISVQEKSKQIYFIKKGEVEFKVIATLLNSDKKDAQKTEILKQFDVFGMDTLHTIKQVDTMVEYSARSISDCELYCIDKRILAIVISSFQEKFQVKDKIVKAIDMNSQITGQNYTSFRQELLTQNAERIKTSEKKIRDVKLQSYSRKNKRVIDTFIPEKDRVKEAKVQIKSNQVKFQSSAGFKMLKSKSLKSQASLMNLRQSTDSMFWTLKSKFEVNSPKKQQIKDELGLNHMVLPLVEESAFDRKNHTLLSCQSSNQFQRIRKRSLNIFSQSRADKSNSNQKNKTQFNSTTRSFIPKVRSKSSIFQTISNSGKIQSEIIQSYLQKKTKNEIVRKAQEVLERKNNIQRSSIKNIKKFYNTESYSPTKKVVSVVPIEKKTRKELTDQLVNRLANIKEYPLLSLIQIQRKKMDSLSKAKPKNDRQIQLRRSESIIERKAKINDTQTLVLNSQEFQETNRFERQRTYPISSSRSNFISEQN